MNNTTYSYFLELVKWTNLVYCIFLPVFYIYFNCYFLGFFLQKISQKLPVYADLGWIYARVIGSYGSESDVNWGRRESPELMQSSVTTIEEITEDTVEPDFLWKTQLIQWPPRNIVLSGILVRKHQLSFSHCNHIVFVSCIDCVNLVRVLILICILSRRHWCEICGFVRTVQQ